ncbi:hypothetical protein LCGC14_1750070 [marine sediment metagenome]|uniref:Uncharacterized protein n=1 Tax=marine sediment metagenome TaxID=412755 RepID=A0A0F9HRI7_9ZZZZ
MEYDELAELYRDLLEEYRGYLVNEYNDDDKAEYWIDQLINI